MTELSGDLRALIVESVAQAYVDACEEATTKGKREPTFEEWRRKRLGACRPKTADQILTEARAKLDREALIRAESRRGRVFSWEDVVRLSGEDDYIDAEVVGKGRHVQPAQDPPPLPACASEASAPVTSVIELFPR